MKKCEGDVIFEKPDIRALADEGFTTCDMHFHTNHSDSATRVKDLLKLAGKIGSGVSITDHNQISGYFEARRFGGDVFLIPGIEVSSADGPHILLYFFDHSSMKEYYDIFIAI